MNFRAVRAIFKFEMGRTWRTLGYPGLPHEAPPEVQDEAARKLQAQLARHRSHEVVSVQHELAAALNNSAPVAGHQLLRPHRSRDPTCSLRRGSRSA